MDRKELLAKAKAIIDNATAAARDLTNDETAEVESLFQQVEQLDAKGADSVDLVKRLEGLGQGGQASTKTAAAVWSKGVVDKYFEASAASGVKALTTGTIDTPPAVDVVDLPTAPTRVLDLIPREGLKENTFEYLRQIVATHNAGPVADGATKPTSIYTFEQIEDRARVFAHLSEPFPLRFAQDHTSMMQVLDQQMAVGLVQALEASVLMGNTALDAEDFTGIWYTSGIGATAQGTNDVPTTLRKARTKLEARGERVTAVVMNPAALENLDLLREDGTTGGYLVDSAVYERILGPGVVPIPSTAINAGYVLMGDFTQTRLLVRQTGHTLAATQAGDLFETNRMRLRTEGRYGFKMLRPQAFEAITLA